MAVTHESGISSPAHPTAISSCSGTNTVCDGKMTALQRFLNVMDYKPVDQVPNWEAGAWSQTIERWQKESAGACKLDGFWFPGVDYLGMDPREFISFNGGMIPCFTHEVLSEDADTQTFRDSNGCVRRTLKAGAVNGGSACMDTFLSFPVEGAADWQEIKKRFDPTHPRRYEPNWRTLRVAGWHARKHPLIFGHNCATLGFYWTARELLGTEGVSYAWYDQPEMMHDMMHFWGDFLIETARPILEATSVEYICLNEDLSMKNGPLLSPETYREFILPHLKRVIEFYRGHGVRHVCIDTDGDPEALIPMMMDVGVDAIWPLERAAGQDPLRLRKKFGRSLRLWGGVDKRELAKGPAATDAHLRELRPLIEEGGFIPTVDHTVSPDVSWENFLYYVQAKQKLLNGTL